MASAGDHLGPHYRLLQEIGEGAMGVVWKAEDTLLQRLVAIKFLTADQAVDAKRRDAFLREARMASSLSDGRVAQVYEFSREGLLDYIVMEFVEGTSLGDMLRDGALPPATVVALGEQAALALAAVHRAGILHRDIKPSNLVVTPQGVLKVVDFGLAALREAPEAPRPRPGAPPHVTPPDAGKVAGTIPFMSPEQILRLPLGPPSDVFALGVVLYQMATGTHPFPGTTRDEVVALILAARPRRPRSIVPSLPESLERILLRALAKPPEDRFPSMDALATELCELRHRMEGASSPRAGGDRPRPRWGRPAAWTLLAAAAAGTFGGWWYLRTSETPPAAVPYEFPLHLRGSPDFITSPKATAVLRAWRRPGPAAFDAADRLVAAFPGEIGAQVLRVYFLGSYLPMDRERLRNAIEALDHSWPGTPYADLYRARIDIAEGRPADGAERLERVLSRSDLEPALRALVHRSRARWSTEHDPDYLAFDLPPERPAEVDPKIVEDLEESIRLDPEAPWGHLGLAWYLRFCGRFDEALREAERAEAMDPSFPLNRFTVAGLLALEGRWSDAARELEAACAQGSTVPCGLLPLTLYRAGRPGEAAARAESAAVGDDSLALYHLARYHAAVGDRGRALTLVGRAVDAGFDEARIERDLEFSALRDDPGFLARVAEIRARAVKR